MGWDAFGLPRKRRHQNKTHPRIWTNQKRRGIPEDASPLRFSYDWRREISTCDPNITSGTSGFFLRMLERIWLTARRAGQLVCKMLHRSR